MPEDAHSFFDGSWVDIASFVVAALYALFRWMKCDHKLISQTTGLTVAHGCSIFPLFLLVMASLSSVALNALLQTNKLILSIAGVVALLSILEERPPKL